MPKPLSEGIIKANHDPVYVAHPRTKRTVDLISLSYWWPSMRKIVEECIRECDSSQRRKEEREFVAPLGKTEETSSPFEVTSMGITGPYLVTPRKNMYLLKFIEQFSKWVEAYSIPDINEETCEIVYSSQILTLAQDPLYWHTTAHHLCPHFLRKIAEYLNQESKHFELLSFLIWRGREVAQKSTFGSIKFYWCREYKLWPSSAIFLNGIPFDA